VSGISSKVRVASLAVALTDTSGAYRSRPGDTGPSCGSSPGPKCWRRARSPAADGDTLAIAFQPPVEIAAGAPLDLTLVGDLAPAAPFGPFLARLADTSLGRS